MVRERQYSIPGCHGILRTYLQEQLETKRINFSNARLVRNLLEKAIRRQALRLVQQQVYGRNDLMLLLRKILKNQQKKLILPRMSYYCQTGKKLKIYAWTVKKRIIIQRVC